MLEYIYNIKKKKKKKVIKAFLCTAVSGDSCKWIVSMYGTGMVPGDTCTFLIFWCVDVPSSVFQSLRNNDKMQAKYYNAPQSDF